MGWFEVYEAELQVRDLAVLKSFRGWLDGAEPTPEAAKGYLAHLREKGYRPRSVLFHYHALQGLFNFLGQPLKLRLRKPRPLPPYHDAGDIERLIAQAERGLKGHTPELRQRNTALVLIMAYAGLRRG